MTPTGKRFVETCREAIIKNMQIRRIAFFLNFEPNPPTVTHQEKKVRVVNGKPMFYMPPELKEARALFTAKLKPFAPKEPWNCPIMLCISWRFRFPVSRRVRNDAEWVWKTTKPDVDNLRKMLQDVMTDCGFWKDDSLVCRVVEEKKEYPADEKHGVLISITDLSQTQGEST